ncbi:DNA-directed DNA polymerase gamma mip1 [Coemansia sp. RSA 552]|nr:DNA-directed DNA polymerase gamma mip1 [Coemansia sp. RSA 552]
MAYTTSRLCTGGARRGLRGFRRSLGRSRASFHSAGALLGDCSDQPRKNDLDIVMLAPRLRQSIFRHRQFPEATPEQATISVDHLRAQGIYGKEGEPVDGSDFDPPELLGANIEEHFHTMGSMAAQPYLRMATEHAEIPWSSFPTRPKPEAWRMQSGWTRYNADGSCTRVPIPDAADDVLVFDVEVLVPDSPYPVLAAALSRNAWYLWVSPYLSGDSSHPRHLIPLLDPQEEAQKPRLVIGHNVGYDRARIQEARRAKRPPLAFIDTMSLHVSSGGLCSRQRPSWMKYSRAKSENDTEYLHLNEDTGRFFDVSCLNSLREVAKHYCNINMSKERRNVFVKGTLAEVRETFADLADYCALDVEVTYKVYAEVFPAFRINCPHPVSFAGSLMMLEGYLPVDRSWPEYIRQSEALFAKLSESVASRMLKLAEDALTAKNPQDDPWLRNLDWTVVPQKYTKPKLKVDGSYAKGGEPRPVARQLLPGKPKWYRLLWDANLKQIHVTVRSRIAPYLLKLKWLGYPLYHSTSYGWTFRVPVSDYQASLESSEEGDKALPSFKNMRVLKFPLDPEDPVYEKIPAEDAGKVVFFKVPHPDGESANCGNPLAKSYRTAIDEGTLSSAYPMAKEAMEMNAMCSYWISARERVKSQFVVWDEGADDAFTGQPLDLGLESAQSPGQGVILPLVVPMGTITRRAVESTWMTASNAKENRLGSELKAMVRCPAGYRFVGADVDSEELWISALIGDSQFRMHGATAFGWMTLQGTKSAGTDLHSNTARILGIGRGSAKVFNYGRIYGAGVKYATTLLLQFNPDMAEADAREKAERLYASTKGMNIRGKNFFGRPFWYGGTESYMFNQLEHFATTDDPRTPALGCGITSALKKTAVGGGFMTSRVNWVVQSSGVDYLHMLLVSMWYLARRYHIDMRFVLSVHDEVRYMVPEHDTQRAALALQISNLWVRSMFSYRLGIEDLPQSVAFFSAVDVDHVLRKEVDMNCVTPTNPHPIAPGESYTIKETLERTNGGQLSTDKLQPARFTLSDNYRPFDMDAFASSDPNVASKLGNMQQPASASESNRPDTTWLMAQMLPSRGDINKLIHATAKLKHGKLAEGLLPNNRTSGYTVTRRITRKSKQ